MQAETHVAFHIVSITAVQF